LNPDILAAASPEIVAVEQQQLEAGMEAPLFTRHSRNPILSRKDWPYPVNSVFNAGVTRL
jgi:hypothetical protein